MDMDVFTADVFTAYCPMPNTAVISKAIWEAEVDTGETVAGAAERSVERKWLANRAERHTIWSLLHASAGEYSYGPVGNRDQIFAHYREMLKMLDEEWLAMKHEIALKKGGGGFKVYPPGFKKGMFGLG